MNVQPFVKFMAERERIRERKEEGCAQPWTKDPILQRFKFTNVKREHDYTSKQLLHLYGGAAESAPAQQDLELMVYNAGVGRYFGHWEMYEALSWRAKHDASLLIRTATRRFAEGLPVFTGAYVVTNGGRAEAKQVVVADYLGGLWEARKRIAAALAPRNGHGALGSWREAAQHMYGLPGFGGTGFMTKETLLDVLMVYGQDVLPLSDRDSWTPVGPGARRGINRIMGREHHLRFPPHAMLADCRAIWDAARPLMKKAMGVDLTVSDVQFQACEFDKYERARLGQGRPRNIYKPRQGE